MLTELLHGVKEAREEEGKEPVGNSYTFVTLLRALPNFLVAGNR